MRESSNFKFATSKRRKGDDLIKIFAGDLCGTCKIDSLMYDWLNFSSFWHLNFFYIIHLRMLFAWRKLVNQFEIKSLRQSKTVCTSYGK